MFVWLNVMNFIAIVFIAYKQMKVLEMIVFIVRSILFSYLVFSLSHFQYDLAICQWYFWIIWRRLCLNMHNGGASFQKSSKCFLQTITYGVIYWGQPFGHPTKYSTALLRPWPQGCLCANLQWWTKHVEIVWNNSQIHRQSCFHSIDPLLLISVKSIIHSWLLKISKPITK